MDDYAGDDWSGDEAGDDGSGSDFSGDDVLGAARRYARARARGRRGGRSTALGRPLQSPPGWRAAQQAPGVMAPTEQLLPLGFQSLDSGFTFVSGGGTTKAFLARPQKPFRGERLLVVVTKSAGAAATQVLIGSIFVGTDLQVVSAAPLPAEVFGATAFGVRLAMTSAQPGIDIFVNTALSGPALAVGETITVTITMLGRAIL